MRKGLRIDQNHINQDIYIDWCDIGINYKELKETPIPLVHNPKLRFITIANCLNFYQFSDNVIININKQIKNLLGDDLSVYKFVISLETEENATTPTLIEALKKMVDNVESIVITVNIEVIERNSIIFLNNPPWIHCDLDNLTFFEFWKYLKKKDLGTIKKKFMFLNNHYSEIRFDILKFLYKNKFNNEGNISFNLINFDDSSVVLNKEKFLYEVNHFGIEYPKYYDALPSFNQIDRNKLDMRDELIGINSVTTLPDFNYRIYLESFFEIITETANHLLLPGVHISEKLHKPLRTAFPFVYHGNPKLKTILEKIGLTFESPIYFFGMDKKELINHLSFILSQDLQWYNTIQHTYLEEYFNNMDKWNEFINDNNKQFLKFSFL